MQAYFSIDGNEYAGMPFTSDDDFTLYYVLKENGKVGIELVFYGDSGTPGTIGTLFFKVSKASY